MTHIPDKYEHLVRYYGYCSNCSRGGRKQVEQEQGATLPTSIDESPIDYRSRTGNRDAAAHVGPERTLAGRL